MEVSAPRSHRNEDVGRSHDPDLAYRRFVEDSQRLFSSTANEFERIYWIRARAEEREGKYQRKACYHQNLDLSQNRCSSLS
jgi:hypothetical protein